MFAKTIINSARFLRMPPSSRLLYYDLGMAADDDGVVEAFTVMRTTGATEDDLRVLAAKGFIRILNDDLVTLIKDWRRNNLIKSDRYHPSVYADLLVEIQDGTQSEPTWNPSGTQLEPEVRLGKESIGQDIERDAPAPRDTFIPPSGEEVQEFMNSCDDDLRDSLNVANESARFLDFYTSNGWKAGRNPMQDWRASARNWLRRAQDSANSRASPGTSPALVAAIRDLGDLSKLYD